MFDLDISACILVTLQKECGQQIAVRLPVSWFYHGRPEFTENISHSRINTAGTLSQNGEKVPAFFHPIHVHSLSSSSDLLSLYTFYHVHDLFSTSWSSPREPLYQTTEVLDSFPTIPVVQEAEPIQAEAENPEVTIPQEA